MKIRETNMSDGDICGRDAAAYALGALEPGEAEAFQTHVQHCSVCQEELESLRQLVDLLPMSALQYRSPRRLKRRVMSAVRAEEEAARPVRRAAPVRPKFAWAGGAVAAMACAAALGAVAFGGGSSLPATHVYDAEVGAAKVRVSGNRAELIVQHLPQLPPGRIYEVWLERDSGGPLPTKALFGVTRSGQADEAVPGYNSQVKDVLVTAEPAGGSQQPTSSPVIVANL